MVSKEIENLEKRYKQSRDLKIGEKVFTPCLKECSLYRRGTGTFGSSAFKNYLGALGDIISSGAKLEIITSMNGIADDSKLFSAIKGTQDEYGRKKILQEYCDKTALIIAGCNSSSNSGEYFQKLIAYLIANKQLEIKFALPLKDGEISDDFFDPESIKQRAMYHFKYGYYLFPDKANSCIAFEGSVNETDTALFHSGEHVTLYKSWVEGQNDDVITIRKYMDEDWEEKNKDFRFFNISDETIEVIKTYSRKINGDKRPIKLDPEPKPSPDPEPKPSPEPTPEPNPEKKYFLKLREYQKEAFDEWVKNDFKGIIALATGTGKTMTALESILRFKKNNSHGFIFIVVPSQPLAVQWKDDLLSLKSNFPIIEGYESRLNWGIRLGDLINQSKISKLNNAPIIVTVSNTFKTKEFQGYLNELSQTIEKNHFIIVDECHRFNKEDQVKFLPDSIKIRMGLSATPYDQFEGAKEKRYLEDYFGKIVSTYSIGEAIKDKWLTKYEYHVVETYMNDNELKEYEDLSESIRKLQGDDPDMAAIKAIKLFERARLIGSIEDKLHKLKDIIREKTANKLVYCGDAKDDFGLKQIENVSKIFNERGWNTGKITADESPKERKKTIENLKDGLIDIIVSIRVLDEGVNIPSVERAYILASRRSEREYIQRRGRVLRLSNNKDKAIIYDFVVMGAFSSSKNFNNLHKAEFERVRTFAKDASNKDSLYIKYENYFNLLDEDD